MAAWRSAATNVSIPGLAAKLFDPGHKGSILTAPLLRSPTLAWFASAAGSIAVLTGLVLTIRRARARHQRDLAFGLTLVACILISPVSWEHYFVLLLLPLALLHCRLSRFSVPYFVFWALVALLCLSPTEFWNLAGLRVIKEGYTLVTPWQTLTVLSLQLYAVLALFGWLMMRLLAETSSGATQLYPTSGDVFVAEPGPEAVGAVRPGVCG
jgi:hypothetical protein